ncbi:MAG: ATP-binding cassette domain-containing protein [Solimonas sp.]
MRNEDNTHPLIALSHCSVKLGHHWALNDVSFNLHRGERWVLLGSNGAGKSVLLKLLRGDMWPTPTGSERRSYFFGNQHSNQPVGIKHRIALLTPETQDRYVRYDWNHTVTQVVTTGLFDEDIPLTKPDATQRRRVDRMLQRCKLWSLRQRRFLTLSYGQRRRVLLARTLISKPDVSLLDEVFNGLDAIQRNFLMTVLNGREAYTWIVAAHSSSDIPDNATHVMRLHQGKLVEAGKLSAARRIQLQKEELQRTEIAASPKKLAIKTAKPFITLKNIELYRDYRPVLKKFEWAIHRHEHWVIMGANGSGKSTLLMMLYGDLHPALGGEVIRDGHQKGTPIAKWKKRVGWVSPELQADHFHAGTLEYIVASGRYSSVGLNDAITASDRRIAREGLALVGLDGYQQRGVREVSYGQMRLALLARAMVNKPELLLLDEPFTGLDMHWRAAMQRAIETAIASGMQVIMAVHQKADLIPSINRMLKIEKGGRVVIRELG